MLRLRADLSVTKRIMPALRWLVLRLSLVTLVLGSACSGSSDPRLLEGSEANPDSELERLRQLQLVRVWDLSQDPPVLLEKTADEIVSRYEQACTLELSNTQLYPLAAGTNTCAYGAYAARTLICAAHYLAEAATIRAEPLALKVSTASIDWQVPAQSSATNAALLRWAARAAEAATSFAEVSLRSLAAGTNVPWVASSCDTTEAAVRADGSAIRVQLATAYAESYHLFREVIEKSVDATVAVAEAQRSSTSTLQLASNRAVAGAELSRSHAAHLLVGGSPGIFGSTENAFCSSPELSPQARLALRLMREAGIAPKDVLALPGSGVTSTNRSPAGEVSIAELTDAATSVLSSGSIRLRLQELWGQSISSPLTASFGLNDNDFVEARQYLASEIKAFARSQTAVLSAPALTNNRVPSLMNSRYAGIGTQPEIPPSEYYAALSRWGTLRPPGDPYGSGLPPWPTFDSSYKPVFANYVERAVARAGDLAKNTALPADVANPLAQVLQGAANEYLGRIGLVRGSTNAVNVFAYGFGPSDGLKAVIGEDALRCYVNGNVEGAPCTLTGYSNVSLTSTPPTWPPLTKSANAINLTAPSAGVYGVYVLRPRPEIVPRLPSANPANARAGDFEALGGALIDFSAATGSFVVIPIVPDAARRAAAVLAPSPKWCTQSSTTCVDTVFDDRMPLEDELVDNGDGVENSWRHYLEQARQAATEADGLGDAVIQSGLDLDLRTEELELRREQQRQHAESEIEELQAICGTAVDASVLLELLGGGAGTGSCTTDSNCTGGRICVTALGATTGTCVQNFSGVRTGTTCTTDSNCGSDSICAAGQCIRDIEKLAKNYTGPYRDAVNRLAECIGRTNVLDLATVGDDDVCVWVEADPNRVCQRGTLDGNAKYACPAKMEEGSCDYSDFGFLSAAEMPSGTTPKQVTNKLKFLDSTEPTTGGSDANIQSLCQQIRTMRLFPGAGDLGRLISSGLFHPDRLGQIAARVQWEARYNNHSAIVVDGAVRYGTGDVYSGPQPQGTWPCGGPKSDCGTNNPSLFCTQFNCSTASSRNEINERMLQAVLGLDVVARNNYMYGGFVTITQPVESSIDNWAGDGPVQSWRTTQYNIPLQVYTSADISYYDINTTASDPRLIYSVNGTPWYMGEKFAFFLQTKLRSRSEDLGILTGMSLDNPDPDIGARTSTVFNALNGWYGSASTYSSYRIRDADGDSLELDLNPNGGKGVAGTEMATVYDGLQPYDYNLRSILDGLELACEIEAGVDVNCDVSDVPTVSSVADLSRANDFLQCTARQIEQQAAHMVFANVPQAVLGALEQSGVAGTYASVAGEYGEELTTLRAALIELASVGPQIAAEIRHLGYDIRDVQTQLELTGVQDSIADLEFASTLSAQLAACASTFGIGNMFSLSPMATCANSLAQISFAGQIRDLQQRAGELEDDLTISRFGDEFASRTENLQGFATLITERSEEINGALANLEEKRNRALRAIARAIQASSFTAQNEAHVTAAMLTRYATNKQRYERARKNAQKMAFLAKRAIEQRLGMHLAEMRDDLPLVEAPALWESEVCTSSGLDYLKFREPINGDLSTFESATSLANSFADAYVGEYVRKLENVVESYRLVHGFHEGNDTAIISLRDDVQNVRAMCGSPVDNLLYEAGQFDAQATGDRKGWAPVGCLTQVRDPAWEPKPLDIPNLDTWFRSDHPNIVLQPGTEQSARDIKSAPLKGEWNSTSGMNRGVWQNGNTANQPSQRIFAEGLAALFGNADALTSDQAASRYSYLHGSAGTTLALVYRPTGTGPTNYLVRTTGGGPTNVGFLLRYDNNQFKVWIANGTAYWYAVSTGTYPTNQTYRIVVRFNGTGLQVRVNGAVAVSGTPTGSPSTATPAATLSIGATGNTYSVNGYVPEVLLYNRYLADTEVTTLETYLNRWQLAQETTAVAGEEQLVENCVAAFPKSSGVTAVQTSDFSSVRAYDIQFGDGTTDCRNAIACGYDPHKSALVQRVLLPPGRYRLSYSGEYQLGNYPIVTACNPPATDPQVECQTPVAFSPVGSGGTCETLPSGWRRCSLNFDVSQEQVIEVGFGQVIWGRGGDSSQESNPLYPRLLTRGFAAMMLEDVTATSSAISTFRTFANTGQTLEEDLPLCEDSDGTEFRRTRWARRCVRLCPDGFASECSDAQAQTHCFRETDFSINQRDIESGRILNQSGFARGNFNYRIDSMGVNFVGSGVRNCADSELPTTCYSAGFVPYSLEHQGPYTVRNHMGQDFRAALFTGHIEHARGLAAERYLTNPISSSDQELIEQYLRPELQGRPLDGNFVLRVWEEEGVNFDGIQDVQVVLKYRYWTRFD